MVSIPTLGRRGLPAAPATAPAAGNSKVTSDARGSRAAMPGHGDGIDRSPVGGRDIVTPPQQLQERLYTGTQYQNGKLQVRDRHIIERTGTTKTSNAFPNPWGGIPNPEADGPPRPAPDMLNRSLTWQIGTDGTRNLDNTAYHAATSAGARRFPLGNQGSSPWERKNGGTPGLYRPYGARGYVEGPEPRVTAQPGGQYPVHMLLDPGAPQDGPQMVFGGYPHGLHSQTVPGTKVTKSRYEHTVQQKQGRQDRPSNSKIAGQSYSQTVIHQSGAGGGPMPVAPAGRVAGVTGRFVTRKVAGS